MTLQTLSLAVVGFMFLIVPYRAQVLGMAGPSPRRVIVPDTPQNARLVDAVRRGDLPAVQAALAEGASADTRTGWEGQPELTPVALLAAQGPSDIAVLTARGASDGREQILPIFRLLVQNVSAASAADTRTGPSLLRATITLGDLDSLRCLVAKGADVRTPPLLHGAIEIDCDGITVKALSPITAFLLDQGVQVNAQDAEGRTPLMFAATYGKGDVVRALLAHGADPALRDKRGWTALRWAVAGRGGDKVIGLLRDRSPMTLSEAALFGDVARLRAHLDAGENPNTPVAQGEVPLLAAMKSGSVATARLLLDRGADVKGRRPDGTTALHLAALYGDVPLAGLLLDRGADINAVAHRQYGTVTPLALAVTQAQADMVALLIRRGVNLKGAQGADALESAVREAGNGLVLRPRDIATDRIPRGEAAYDARERIIELLLDGGVDVRADHSRALFLAAAAGQAGLIEVLLNRGADVNARGPDTPDDTLDTGQTALMGAIDSWRGILIDRQLLKHDTPSAQAQQHVREEEQFARRSVELLLARGADVNRPDARGTTPLMQCVSSELPALAPMLLARGAQTDAADPQGRTALMRAAAEGDSALVALLLSHHAGVNRRDKVGRTALMLAIDDGSNDDYRRYRAARAEEDEGFRRPAGGTPIPVPAKDLPNPNGHPETVRLLLRHGATVNAVAQDGSTALSLAGKQGFRSVAALLTQAGARR